MFRYGSIIASIPVALSRFSVVLETESDMIQAEEEIPPQPSPRKAETNSDGKKEPVEERKPDSPPKKKALLPEPDEMQIAIDDDDD